ncbi:MAG: LytR C-terminal domain-containing protein [Solirubrobacteraceae bacterium]
MTFGVLPSAASFASNFDVIGPYVGFVAIIGVVAMGILVFAQGRELQRLREWVGTSPERLAELEERVASGGVSQPPRNVQSAPRPPRPAGPGALPNRPVGPPGAAVPPRPVGSASGPASASAATAAAASAAAVRASGSGSGPAQLAAGTGATATADAPARPAPPKPPGSTTTGDGDGPDRSSPPKPTPPSPSGPAPATAAALAASTQRERQAHAEAAIGPPGGGPSIPQAVGVATVLVVVVAALLFALGVIGGGETSPVKEDNKAAERSITRERAAKPYSPAETKVTVLNGSSESGLAKGASTSLENARFISEFGDYTENGVRAPQAQTTVAYRTGAGGGSKAKAAAVDVARLLKIRANQVRTMSTNIRLAAEGSPQVVVVLGADYASRQGVAPADQSGVPPEQQSTTGSGSDAGTGSGTGDAVPAPGITAPNP